MKNHLALFSYDTSDIIAMLSCIRKTKISWCKWSMCSVYPLQPGWCSFKQFNLIYVGLLSLLSKNLLVTHPTYNKTFSPTV